MKDITLGSGGTGEGEMIGFFSKMRSYTSMTEKIIQEKDPISIVFYFGISFTSVIVTWNNFSMPIGMWKLVLSKAWRTAVCLYSDTRSYHEEIGQKEKTSQKGEEDLGVSKQVSLAHSHQTSSREISGLSLKTVTWCSCERTSVWMGLLCLSWIFRI